MRAMHRTPQSSAPATPIASSSAIGTAWLASSSKDNRRYCQSLLQRPQAHQMRSSTTRNASGGAKAPPLQHEEMCWRLVERPDQSPTGDVIRDLVVDGEGRLERKAGRAEVIVQILATDAHVLEELILEAAARHPTEQIGSGAENGVAPVVAVAD